MHRGTGDQMPDPLIEAKQGEGNAPAYRGTAYVVIERFPIDDYGRRIPQFQFEVMRPVGALNGQIRSVALIPGSTEYGLLPRPVKLTVRPGEDVMVNRHMLSAASDIEASLDELQALCPRLEAVALVVTWFGDDLRAGHCRLRPMVTQNDPEGLSETWTVSGLARDEVPVVSMSEGGPAYGGTPSDASVIEAIKLIRARGLKVTLYPFVMMDVPAENMLPNPYGGASQPAYPWRGRITCDPAPGATGSADKAAAARMQVEAFAGQARLSDFAATDEEVRFTGDADDWGYRRFLLHYAKLAEAAGGVDGFLIGSELRGLTVLRDGENRFPFVEVLAELAGEVRGVLGQETLITYGADWSEYFGHQPQDGSGDVFFHLDPLWAHDAVDAVGIDNYMPLSDWRDADHAGGNPDGFLGPYDAAGLRRMITSGEGYDWFYADAGDRPERRRTPITDGAHGKPWVYRYKDIASWWSNPHFDRIGGVEAADPTAWVPKSKPVIFTEIGCAAVDKGPNQPNVFPDPKSSENAAPYFSSGGMSDLAQRRFLAAHYGHWSSEDAAVNPVSNLYGGRMVDPGSICVWAWDARPFPAFPLHGDVWSDGRNWSCGHWLNGRLSGVAVDDLINAILADFGLSAADTDGAEGSLAGYVVADPGTARAALEPVCDLFGLAVREDAGRLVFSTETGAGATVEPAALVVEEDAPVIERVRDPDSALPTGVVVVIARVSAPPSRISVGTIRPRVSRPFDNS
ncbi:putative tail protein [Mesorhizobium sp. J18]|nr:glycoside hydrolase TIM-barrel-like domain-containing protein [Mesorhizobium sp. J18]TWG99318.1 putative tail protein [Mesorhizobium sp. J18]